MDRSWLLLGGLIFTVVIILAIVFTTLFHSTKKPVEIEPANTQPTAVVPPEKPPEAQSGEISIELDNAAATALVNRYLPGDLPIKNLSLAFYTPNGLTIDGEVEAQKLISQLGSELPEAVRAALKLLPETAEAGLDLSVFSDGKGGLSAEILSFEIGGIGIDGKYLPGNLTDMLSKALSDAAQSSGMTVRRIIIDDGLITIYGAPSEQKS